MSLWRNEESKQLPELQSMIAARDVHTPIDLWMALYFEFDRLARERPIPSDLLGRIWRYANWSANHSDEAVQFAAISFFFEELQETRNNREAFPTFMTDKEYAQLFDRTHTPKQSPK
jgi:hypothetical protein